MSKELTLDTSKHPLKTKETVQVVVKEICEAIDAGHDPLETLENLTFLAEVAEEFRKAPGMVQTIRKAIIEGSMDPEFGHSGIVETNSAIIKLALVGNKIDYAGTGDPAWAHYKEQEELWAKKRKDREKFLAALDESLVVQFRDEEAEGKPIITKKVSPPVRSGTESFTISLKK